MWQQLKEHKDYEILSEYDETLKCYPIRKIGKNRIVKTHIAHNGYVRIHLNALNYPVHRIIAEQFIINDDIENKIEIDHIDRNKNNNKIDNLRWCSRSENLKNLTKYKGEDANYFDKLPNGAFQVEEYGKHRFENLYYCDDVFYLWNGIQYREIKKFLNKRDKIYCINAIDTDEKNVVIYYTKFKRMYNLD